MERKIGFIGGGRITRIFLEAWKKDKQQLDNVIVSDASQETLGRLKGRFPEITAAAQDNSLPAGAEIVFLALHPPAVKDTLEKIKGSFSGGTILVSLAPRIRIEALAAMTGIGKIVRMIPNAPSIVGKGYNPVAFSPGMSKSERKEFLKIIKPLGDSPEVEEDKLEAYAIMTAMGPTYLWFQLAELNEMARSFGLSEKEAGKAISKMAKGAVKTLFDSGLTPPEVFDLVPVKPLAEDEAGIREIYKSRLNALYAKLKG